jgi:hypothetical protein
VNTRDQANRFEIRDEQGFAVRVLANDNVILPVAVGRNGRMPPYDFTVFLAGSPVARSRRSMVDAAEGG